MNERLTALEASNTVDTLRDLRAAWSAHVESLDVTPFPPTRACPHCGDVGMLAATRCGRCWRALVPPAVGR